MKWRGFDVKKSRAMPDRKPFLALLQQALENIREEQLFNDERGFQGALLQELSERLRTPRPSSLSLSANSSPPRRSMGGAPSRVASLTAAGVNVPVLLNRPLSARPTIAPRKSLISPGPTEPL
jgi:hypothetical protein